MRILNRHQIIIIKLFWNTIRQRIRTEEIECMTKVRARLPVSCTKVFSVELIVSPFRNIANKLNKINKFGTPLKFSTLDPARNTT